MNKEKEDSPEVLSYVLKAYGLEFQPDLKRAAILPKAKFGKIITTNELGKSL